MDKMTYAEARRYLIDFNEKHDIHSKGTKEAKCVMVAVISEDSFKKPYSLKERSYAFSNDNKAFMPNMGGYSIFASSLDGTDIGVRLEQYLAAEGGGKDGWKVDYCYILKEDSDVEYKWTYLCKFLYCGDKSDHSANIPDQVGEMCIIKSTDNLLDLEIYKVKDHYLIQEMLEQNDCETISLEELCTEDIKEYDDLETIYIKGSDL